MRTQFNIFAYPVGDVECRRKTEFEFTSFITSLSAKRRKFTVTPWSSGSETGFIVWHS